MQDNEKRVSIIVDDDDHNQTSEGSGPEKMNKQRIKKLIIFVLMGIVFLGCLFLIFKPSKEKNSPENAGLNEAVPEATDAGMQSDKQKAYEQDLLEEKEREKRNALTTLSDYWNEDGSATDSEGVAGQQNRDVLDGGEDITAPSHNPTLQSYRSAQNALGSFYSGDNGETIELRRQVDELKDKLAEKELPKPTTVADQLALMEKSYQMAAKYLPSGSGGPSAATDSANRRSPLPTQKEYFVSFTPPRKNIVSALYREPSDSAFAADLSETRNRFFYNAVAKEKAVQPKNSIKAIVHESQTVVGETGVRLRLLEPAQTPQRIIPKGTMVTAGAKFQNGRLQLKVTSIELDGNMIRVDLTIYDWDGQQGLAVPYSPEMSALSEMAGNMSQTGGTSVMLTQNAGQQVASDLSRGVVQGISGYFAKKVRTPKVTLKAGHQVFLVSKK
ncbi:conjugative transposon protein TraM [Chryseobacterium shandongense]|uniref:Conjugative transposon protein TraM n=1 Tax=Chryseobacterium shandongense TaxID=1493872 RepID=A0ABN5RYD0_9FLAO|nr:conjugative transposon protein TraM [Chryseobacterium shandongense]AZA95640.1 conjugative transposon protein TraM [Chryseobacterium shandongense]